MSNMNMSRKVYKLIAVLLIIKCIIFIILGGGGSAKNTVLKTVKKREGVNHV